jgi:hypothetical protein
MANHSDPPKPVDPRLSAVGIPRSVQALPLKAPILSQSEREEPTRDSQESLKVTLKKKKM